MTKMQLKKRPRYTIDTSIERKVDDLYQTYVRPRQQLLDSEKIAHDQMRQAVGLRRNRLFQKPLTNEQADKAFKVMDAHMKIGDMMGLARHNAPKVPVGYDPFDSEPVQPVLPPPAEKVRVPGEREVDAREAEAFLADLGRYGERLSAYGRSPNFHDFFEQSPEAGPRAQRHIQRLQMTHTQQYADGRQRAAQVTMMSVGRSMAMMGGVAVGLNLFGSKNAFSAPADNDPSSVTGTNIRDLASIHMGTLAHNNSLSMGQQQLQMEQYPGDPVEYGVRPGFLDDPAIVSSHPAIGAAPDEEGRDEDMQIADPVVAQTLGSDEVHKQDNGAGEQELKIEPATLGEQMNANLTEGKEEESKIAPVTTTQRGPMVRQMMNAEQARGTELVAGLATLKDGAISGLSALRDGAFDLSDWWFMVPSGTTRFVLTAVKQSPADAALAGALKATTAVATKTGDDLLKAVGLGDGRPTFILPAYNTVIALNAGQLVPVALLGPQLAIPAGIIISTGSAIAAYYGTIPVMEFVEERIFKAMGVTVPLVEILTLLVAAKVSRQTINRFMDPARPVFKTMYKVGAQVGRTVVDFIPVVVAFSGLISEALEQKAIEMETAESLIAGIVYCYGQQIKQREEGVPEKDNYWTQKMKYHMNMLNVYTGKVTGKAGQLMESIARQAASGIGKGSNWLKYQPPAERQRRINAVGDEINPYGVMAFEHIKYPELIQASMAELEAGKRRMEEWLEQRRQERDESTPQYDYAALEDKFVYGEVKDIELTPEAFVKLPPGTQSAIRAAIEAAAPQVIGDDELPPLLTPQGIPDQAPMVFPPETIIKKRGRGKGKKNAAPMVFPASSVDDNEKILRQGGGVPRKKAQADDAWT